MNGMIDISDLESNSGNDFADLKKSVNFGGGLELLMNERVKDARPSSDIDVDDLTNLENELNNLAEDIPSSSYESRPGGLFSKDGFGGEDDNGGYKPSVHFGGSSSINIGQATSETDAGDNGAKTWDGYGKFNNIPVNPDKHFTNQPQITKEELLREKFKFLKKLEAMERKGIELSKKYTMDSPLAEMQGEYETIMEEKTKENSIKFQGNMLMAIINGIEFLNNRFDPFDLKLDGWSDQVNENIEDYDDIFSELHEKYKSRGNMAPEIKMLLQLGGSAMMVHLSNTMFKSAMPGMDDILRQNPDLMRQFQSAAVNTMSSSNPGLAGFMGGIMGNSGLGGGLPPPLPTQGPNSMPPPTSRPGNNNFSQSQGQGRSQGQGQSQRSPFVDDGINIREKNSGPMSFIQGQSQVPERSQRRPEMKGPSDLSDILSGLKTKTIQIPESSQNTSGQRQGQNINQNQNQNQNQTQLQKARKEQFDLGANDDTQSTISISELKELQSSSLNMPKRSGRRQKSDKNTVSLDI